MGLVAKVKADCDDCFVCARIRAIAGNLGQALGQVPKVYGYSIFHRRPLGPVS